ncbi:LacI family transcriptional regulator [Actinomyces sp. 432]|uniref:LacI family DNA-binding transcriptional regulator n=1 Tax=unclassified Actinomyces TaxID=2609248 RepID=UPI001373ED00|nr:MULTISPECIES: LacI family DNA-binding transcriptional regulator [unclassified Actinomyces]MBW3068509.1 LacI family transcriptional regulator [Actinomyces sp. 594]QHO90381.1 LacI family transcriptional regulator [Actinomyces sp. 432]
MARPSVRDVAERAGVSVGTVSHVLNHPERVAQPTIDRVRAAINELGFVRSETARRLRHGGSSLVGVLVHDISNPFFTEAARGIEDRLRADGRVPMLGSTDSDPEREHQLMSLLAGMDVHGVIITPSASTLDNLAVLAGRGIRVVLMDHPPISAELSTVSGDDVAGARAAAAHLIELGHRRIGFVNGPLTVRQAVDRRDGVVAALAGAGLDPAEALTEIEAVSGGQGFTADAGAVGAATLLDGQTPPTALLCANDQLAIGAMREVRRRGLSIPDDVAIVGYDDISVAAELITPLTSVRQPMREMGAAAADLLLSHDPAVRHITFPPRLVVRESTVGGQPRS